MAEDTKSKAGDVLQIRDILFGEQMREYNEQFNKNTQRMDDLQGQIKTLEAKFDKRQQKAEAEINQQIEDLKSMLLAKLEDLEFRSTARMGLGDMLIEIGERLKQNGDGG